MNDYLDAMIEAYDAAIDAWDLHKGQDLGDSIKLMERAAMNAAFQAAVDWKGSYLRKEQLPKPNAARTGSIKLGEMPQHSHGLVYTIVDPMFTSNGSYLGDGVALMSTAHPTCGMFSAEEVQADGSFTIEFPEKDEKPEIDYLAITRGMC